MVGCPLKCGGGSTQTTSKSPASSELALEARVLMIQMRAGEGERPPPRQEAAIVQQDTKLLLHEGVQRLAVAVATGHGATPGVGAAPDQVGQCHAQASPNPLDLVI